MFNVLRTFFASIVSLTLVCALVMPVVIHAQTDPALETAEQSIKDIGKQTGLLQDGKYIEGSDDKANEKFIERFSRIVNIVLGAVGILAATYLIYSGIMWITAGGNEDQITKSKQGIQNAVIGIAIIFLGFIVVNFVIARVIGAVQGV